MKRRNLTRRNLLVITTACLFCCTLAQAKKPEKPPGGGDGGEPQFTIIPFRPTDFATTESYVVDLNEQGQAVGVVGLPSGNVVAVHLDVATEFYTSLLDSARAEGVNNLNQIVGTEYAVGEQHAMYWSGPSAAPLSLPALPGDASSQALAINDAGIIVGASWTPRSPPPANEDFAMGVVWRVFLDSAGDVQVDGPVALGPLAGGSESFAVDLTEVIGSSVLVTGQTNFGGNLVKEAVVWNVSLNADGTLAAPGPAAGLGTLGGQESFATGVNDLGDVCGESDGWPFLAPAGGDVGPLALPQSTIWGRAEDVNDLGDVVGELRIKRWKRDSIGTVHAYLWRGSELIDLKKEIDSQSGWDALWFANVINHSGVIAGWGQFDVKNRGYLLIPNNP